METTTGLIRDQCHIISKTGKVNRLRQYIAHACLEIYPDDAGPLIIHENDVVAVRSRRGNIRVTFKIAGSIKKGVVFLPMHWGKILGNDLNRISNL